jgi:hypothetical protein
MGRLRLGALAAIALAGIGTAFAHHGWAPHFDGNAYVTITGTITDFEFVNPHSYVYLESVNEAGKPESRWCETQSRTQLERRGVGAAQFRIGAPITIEGFVSRQDPLGCEIGTAHFYDGTVLTLRRRDGQGVYGAPLVEGDTSIVGTWYPEAFISEAGSTRDSNVRMTPAGEAAHRGFDWLTQNPTMSCSPDSNIRAWAAPGLPTRIERRDNEILIEHEFMDARRAVRLDGIAHREASPSDLGDSIGRFEGGALLIETAHFTPGALWAGRLHSASLTTTEKLWVDPATGHLKLEWTASDPVYYVDAHRGLREFVRTDLELRRFDCDTEIGHAPTDRGD